MSAVNGTNVQAFISDLNGGVLERQLSTILSDVAAAVMEHGGKGKVKVDINIERIGNTAQVKLPVTLSYCRPTLTGKRSEEAESTSLMYIGRAGLTLFPEDQGQMFTKNGDIAERHPS